MFKGTVSFRAQIRGNSIAVPPCEFIPNEPGIERVQVKGHPNGDELSIVIDLSSVGTAEEGKAIATKMSKVVLDRIALFHRVVIEEARVVDTQFCRLDPKPGVLETAPGECLLGGEAVRLVIGISPATRGVSAPLPYSADAL